MACMQLSEGWRDLHAKASALFIGASHVGSGLCGLRYGGWPITSPRAARVVGPSRMGMSSPSVGSRAKRHSRERGRVAGRGLGRRCWRRPTGPGCTSNLPQSGPLTGSAGNCGSGTAQKARQSEALWCTPPVGTRRPAGRVSCAGLRPAQATLRTTCGQSMT